MIGIVLVTHGRLASEFVTAAEHVVGAQEAMRKFCIGPDDDMEERRAEFLKAVDEVDSTKRYTKPLTEVSARIERWQNDTRPKRKRPMHKAKKAP